MDRFRPLQILPPVNHNLQTPIPVSQPQAPPTIQDPHFAPTVVTPVSSHHGMPSLENTRLDKLMTAASDRDLDEILGAITKEGS
ncbi:hypothetical protein L6452_37116 [Arctium lappa]|uniref:Uncharacterized protein n=1 Tax=Arctium lappa TaxID=4217 RepID=A0ACB8Y1H0_ARCLA|nr:hypothetical protein L6452_37116 [Arctium lappa]